MTTARTLTLLSVVCLLLLAGCATDQVEYVDERGNVLAQDEAGQPILPASPRTATGPVDPMDADIQIGDIFPAPSGSAPIAMPGTRRQATKPKPATKTGVRVVDFPARAPTPSDPLGAPPTGNAAPSASPAYGPNSAPTPTRVPSKPVKPASSSAGLGTPPTQR